MARRLIATDLEVFDGDGFIWRDVGGEAQVYGAQLHQTEA